MTTEVKGYLKALTSLLGEQLAAVGHANGWLKAETQEEEDLCEFYRDPESVVFFRHIDSQAVKCVSSDMLDTDLWKTFINDDVITTYLNSGELVLTAVFGENMKKLFVGALDRDNGVAVYSTANWSSLKDLEDELIEHEEDPDSFQLAMHLAVFYPEINPVDKVQIKRAEVRLSNLLQDCRGIAVSAISDGVLKLEPEG